MGSHLAGGPARRLAMKDRTLLWLLLTVLGAGTLWALLALSVLGWRP